MTEPSPQINKVLIIGSGPIVIGQAAEFDYAGSQACRSVREEGVTTVLVNSNPATIMTDQGIADVVYIEPLTVDVIERIIERERPQGLLPTLGGQTGLNLAVEVAEAGILDKYGVRLLGTPLETIRTAEDRSLFRQLLIEMGEPVPESETVTSLEQAREVARRIGFPTGGAPRLHAGEARAEALFRDGMTLTRQQSADWRPVPFTRYWWKNISWAGKRLNMK